jgi:hypothetical protein
LSLLKAKNAIHQNEKFPIAPLQNMGTRPVQPPSPTKPYGHTPPDPLPASRLRSLGFYSAPAPPPPRRAERCDDGVGGRRGHRPRRGLGGAARLGADRPRRRRAARPGGGTRGFALCFPPLLLAPQGGESRSGGY